MKKQTVNFKKTKKSLANTEILRFHPDRYAKLSKAKKTDLLLLVIRFVGQEAEKLN